MSNNSLMQFIEENTNTTEMLDAWWRMISSLFIMIIGFIVMYVVGKYINEKLLKEKYNKKYYNIFYALIITIAGGIGFISGYIGIMK